MSRTHHHREQWRFHAGHDLWGKGAAGEGQWAYSAENKRIGRRIDRKRAKAELHKVSGD